jgi:hypothetical protein
MPVLIFRLRLPDVRGVHKAALEMQATPNSLLYMWYNELLAFFVDQAGLIVWKRLHGTSSTHSNKKLLSRHQSHLNNFCLGIIASSPA